MLAGIIQPIERKKADVIPIDRARSGVESLLRSVPSAAPKQAQYNLPTGYDNADLRQDIEQISESNRQAGEHFRNAMAALGQKQSYQGDNPNDTYHR
ncbi:MAG: hypothetical protein ABIH82_02250 [Candidatus Woesearchaeota archaeon]